MKNFFKKIKKSKGFTLLFAVLAASLLLSIGLSIFSLTVKELTLSSYGRESQFSFYAADSGAECALYWDIKGHGGATFATSTTYGGIVPYQINCGATTIALSETANDANDATTTFSMPLNDVSNTSFCSTVIVSKYPNSSSPAGIGTTIISNGYNVCDSSANPIWGNPNLVERSLSVTY